MSKKRVATKKSAPQKSAKKGGAAKKRTAPAVADIAEGLSLATVQVKAPTARQVPVTYLAEAPTFDKPKRIHPRRFPPLAPEGEDAQILSASPRANFLRPLSLGERGLALADAPGLEAVTDNIVIVKNTAITSPAQKSTSSNVNEPSVAANREVVMYSGNWYAAVSTDGGGTFMFIDPAEAFRKFDPPNSRFCCDQVVHYINRIDTFVWLLQYGPNTGNNIQRIAFATTAGVANRSWRLLDISTQTLGVPGAFLDFPDLAVGANALYMTTNIFGPGSAFGTAIVRIPFSTVSGQTKKVDRFVSMRHQGFRIAQNCDRTAFFATHEDTTTLRVFSWKESEQVPTSATVKVARWVGGDGYHSRTPDGRRWLDRADSRLTGATMAGNELWFAWGSNRGGANSRPRPFVQIARINSSDMTLIEDINLWDADSAICYAALGTNSNNEVGVSYMIGGGNRFPSHAVGILTGTRRDVIVAEGSRSPAADQFGRFEWGDCLSVRRFFPKQKLFTATGYTLESGGAGNNKDSTPRYVLFGRSSDV